METLYLDTHAAVWLYAGRIDLFPARTRQRLEACDIVVSPMVLLEMQFLREAGKVSFKVDTFIRDMSSELGLRVGETAFAPVVISAARISWTRDPFDRLIVAQAAAEEAGLITRDRAILEHYRRAEWD